MQRVVRAFLSSTAAAARAAPPKVQAATPSNVWLAVPEADARTRELVAFVLSLHAGTPGVAARYGEFYTSDAAFEDPFALCETPRAIHKVFELLARYLTVHADEPPEVLYRPQLVGSERNTYQGGGRVPSQVYINLNTRYGLVALPPAWNFSTTLRSTVVLSLTEGGFIQKHEDRWWGSFVQSKNPFVAPLHSFLKRRHGRFIEWLANR
jgi:hypothetical protein